jgi:hypothetical protein
MSKWNKYNCIFGLEMPSKWSIKNISKFLWSNLFTLFGVAPLSVGSFITDRRNFLQAVSAEGG